jgi:hypothetical protein
MATQTRPRIATKPAGQSGHMALKLPDLVQDATNRKALAYQDRMAFLEAGGKLPENPPLNFNDGEAEYIRQLTGQTDVDSFMTL